MKIHAAEGTASRISGAKPGASQRKFFAGNA
jgi:hypothetical protein